MQRIIRSAALPAALLALAACSFVVDVDDSSYRVSVRPLLPTATAVPDSTPTPMHLPPTSTHTQTHTSPTPTQETWLATATASTPRPTSEKGACIVKTGAVAINERIGPSTSAPRTATSPIPPGSMVAVTEFVAAEGYLWAKDAYGFFVVRQGAAWWVTFTAQTLEWCVELPGYPSGVAPPEPIVSAAPGVWAGPGANRDELLRFGAAIRAAGEQPAATLYGEPYTAELLLANGWFVMRRAAAVTDCPDTTQPASASAEAFIGNVIAAEGTRAQVIIAANECAWPSADYARDWIGAAVQTAAAHGVRALVPIVWNPGAPPLEWVPVLSEAYRDAPIVVAWGMNVYPARPGTGLAARDSYTQYTTWRFELYRHHLRGVPVIVTEYARGDGSEPPDFADIRAWWSLARPQVDMATAWYVSGAGLGHWGAADLRGRLAELAGALK